MPTVSPTSPLICMAKLVQVAMLWQLSAWSAVARGGSVWPCCWGELELAQSLGWPDVGDLVTPHQLKLVLVGIVVLREELCIVKDRRKKVKTKQTHRKKPRTLRTNTSKLAHAPSSLIIPPSLRLVVQMLCASEQTRTGCIRISPQRIQPSGQSN